MNIAEFIPTLIVAFGIAFVLEVIIGFFGEARRKVRNIERKVEKGAKRVVRFLAILFIVFFILYYGI
ncbi:MAG: hypothetical protein AYK19_13720 [Theionarchaea archaeon DG-70-1]|nr:MAG: hypothetical protein AYK19_13720 [Theionarchaea archaeon DG-70-1]